MGQAGIQASHPAPKFNFGEPGFEPGLNPPTPHQKFIIGVPRFELGLNPPKGLVLTITLRPVTNLFQNITFLALGQFKYFFLSFLICYNLSNET